MVNKIVVANVSNGESVLFVNGVAIVSLYVGDNLGNPTVTADLLGKALGSAVSHCNVDEPNCNEWSLDDLSSWLCQQELRPQQKVLCDERTGL